jgi:hypothetical protein
MYFCIQCSLISQREWFFLKVPRLRPFILARATCKMEVSMEDWWNDTDRGKQKCWEKNLS